MSDQNIEWNDIKRFLRRTRKTFLLIFLAVFLPSTIIALSLPSIYRAETSIYIEEQQVPTSFVGSTIESYAEERVNKIEQKVFSYDRLRDIIEKFDLYPEIREKHGIGKAVGKMRQSIGLETQPPDIANPKTDRAVSTIIAFILYHEGRDPKTVMEVANALSELFLEEDVKRIKNSANATTEFLRIELNSLKDKLQMYDDKISEFKQQHLNELPEYTSVNLDGIARLGRELERVNMEIRDLHDRKINLEGQLLSVDPLLPIKIDGESVARNPGERLKNLRLQLISLESVLHGRHPDIVKLKREIRELEKQVVVTGDYQEELKRLEKLKVEFVGMQKRYVPEHPDVIKIAKEIDLLEKSIDGQVDAAKNRNRSEQVSDNPVYVNLTTQISSINATIGNLVDDRKNIQEELDEYRKRIERAPFVEKNYNVLTRDYNTVKIKYDEMMNRLLDANLLKGFEEGQHGQRFKIKNYAQLPDKPFKPNRLAIIVLAFILAAGSGLGVGTLQESLNSSVKTEKELVQLAGLPVLSVISNVETRKDKFRRTHQSLIWIFVILFFIFIGLAIVHEYLIPIDQLWYVILTNAKNV